MEKKRARGVVPVLKQTFYPEFSRARFQAERTKAIRAAPRTFSLVTVSKKGRELGAQLDHHVRYLWPPPSSPKSSAAVRKLFPVAKVTRDTRKKRPARLCPLLRLLKPDFKKRQFGLIATQVPINSRASDGRWAMLGKRKVQSQLDLVAQSHTFVSPGWAAAKAEMAPALPQGNDHIIELKVFADALYTKGWQRMHAPFEGSINSKYKQHQLQLAFSVCLFVATYRRWPKECYVVRINSKTGCHWHRLDVGILHRMWLWLDQYLSISILPGANKAQLQTTSAPRWPRLRAAGKRKRKKSPLSRAKGASSTSHKRRKKKKNSTKTKKSSPSRSQVCCPQEAQCCPKSPGPRTAKTDQLPCPTRAK
jgi:hypothetical protein